MILEGEGRVTERKRERERENLDWLPPNLENLKPRYVL